MEKKTNQVFYSKILNHIMVIRIRKTYEVFSLSVFSNFLYYMLIVVRENRAIILRLSLFKCKNTLTSNSNSRKLSQGNT